MSSSWLSSGSVRTVAGALALLASSGGSLASPYAGSVVSYVPGSTAAAGFTNPQVALGEPSRFTADPQFPGAVTPFAAPYKPSQLVSIGVGGQLTVSFAQPVVDDPLNPFGVDLLIFGNAFFTDPSFAPVATVLFGGGRGVVEVSADGQTWATVTGVTASGVFPTLGYVDITDPFGGPAGSVPTDFTRPVDPNLAWQGLGWQQLVAAYDGSGGGVGVDLAGTGLSSISQVRVSLPAGASGAFQIDGFSDVAAVPGPGSVAAMTLAGLLASRRRRA